MNPPYGDPGVGRPRKTGVVLLPGHEAHQTGAHPENSERLDAVERSLREGADWDRLTVLGAREATVEDIARAHTAAHIDFIRDQSAVGPSWIDGDTVVSPGTWLVTMKAAGAALVAVDAVTGTGQPGGGPGPDSLFALIRPPGHHATADRAMGFCMFNHAAVAARYAQAVLGIERVAILDWDVHHGNGTQDIFEADPSVLFISMHQWPLYPGTGWVDEVGSGEGKGFTVNLPMPPGSGDLEHADAFDRVAGPVIDAFDPGLLIVSAGQDGHLDDPLSNQRLTVAGFEALASRAAGLVARRDIGLVALHEGGYNPETLPDLDHAILAGFGGFADEGQDRRDPSDVSPQRAVSDDWRLRLQQILEAQRPFWGAALRLA
jgi:acetoin utilization deacetylase AcuC-like enzyme